MKLAALVAASLFASASLFGQYTPPAADLRDALKILDEAQKSILPALDAARDDSQVLAMLTRAHNHLNASQPLRSTDDALKVIDEFLERRENIRQPLGRELYRLVMQARSLAGQARTGPPGVAVPGIKDRLHHEFIHPLQQKVVDNTGQIQQIQQQFEFFNGRYLRPPLAESMNAVRYAATEVK